MFLKSMTGMTLSGMMPHWTFGASFWTNSHWMIVGFLVRAAWRISMLLASPSASTIFCSLRIFSCSS
jgi:hypothetical protein